MTVGGAWGVVEADDAAAWARCAQDLGLDVGETLHRVEELCEAMVSVVDSLVRGRLEQLPQRLARSKDSKPFRKAMATLTDGTGSSRPRRTRCPHYGKRTRRRCVRLFRHNGPHRYH